VRLLIKNGRVIDPASGVDETLDILIDRGKIADIKAKIEGDGSKIIDASRLVVAPGFIDMHVHLRQPGQEDKETIKTGSLAAAKGGFTSIACMPNTDPVNDSRDVTEFILSEAKRSAVVNVLPIAAVTRRLCGEEITDMADLQAAGAIAFSDDGHPIENSMVMRRALEYSLLLDALIIDHCEDRNLSAGGLMHEGIYSSKLGIQAIPASAEEILVARDIILAKETKAKLHIAHLSVKGAVELLKFAKQQDVKITAEVTPHHLFLTDALLESFDTNLKVNPPIRSEQDVNSLIDAVKGGWIDTFATDHAPHTPDEKDVELDQAPFGINGLETAVPLFLDKLVNKNILPLEKFIAMISTNPARILGLENKGKISAGADADLTILKLHQDVVVNSSQFLSKSRNTPFDRWKLKGAPVMTIVGGKIVYP
jgi:dihydroorotase